MPLHSLFVSTYRHNNPDSKSQSRPNYLDMARVLIGAALDAQWEGDEATVCHFVWLIIEMRCW